jgi:imidazoleglycerol-phosphate dehydratase
MAERKASVERDTLETQIKASINLDGTGKARFDIGVPFLEHMLDQIARHGLIDLDIESARATCISTITTPWRTSASPSARRSAKAIGDKKGIRRYGHAYVPLDEALSRVVIDFSGRPGLQMHVPYTRATVGGFDVDLFQEFFQGFVNHAQRHVCTSTTCAAPTRTTRSKPCSRRSAARCAWPITLDERMAGQMPSTKGVLCNADGGGHRLRHG